MRTVDGAETWYIRKRLGDGRRLEFAVASNESDARAEWALFSRDMAGYRTPKERAAAAHKTSDRAAVKLDPDTLAEFLKRCRTLVEADEMSANHLNGTLAPYLTQWVKKLGNRDLHKVTLDELQRVLATWTTAHHKRIVALKSFTSWARTEKDTPKLRRAEDPTIDLATPAVRAEKGRRKKGYDVRFVEEFYQRIPDQTVRDIIRLRATANGLHDTEIDRLAQGKGELRKVDDPSGIYGVLVFFQKKKDQEHAISVDRLAFEAAERLLARGSTMAKSAVLDILDRVAMSLHGCAGVSRLVGRRKSGVDSTGRSRAGEPDRRIVPCKKCKRLLPSELRHSFATWASTVGELVHPEGQKGIPLELVAQGMGHTNKGTTKRFYVGDHTPPMYRIPIHLEHPADPR